MVKNMVRFGGGAVLVAAVGLGALVAIDYIRYQKSPEYRAEKEAEQIKKQYQEDPYGGETPEETLRLFVDALKKGDTDLAAKYFVLEKQEEWRADLAKLDEKGLLDETISDLEKVKMTKKTERIAFFALVDQNNKAISELIIQKNLSNNRWKISEF